MMPKWLGLRKEAGLVFVRVIQAYPSVSVEQALVRVQIAAGWRMIVEQYVSIGSLAQTVTADRNMTNFAWWHQSQDAHKRLQRLVQAGRIARPDSFVPARPLIWMGRCPLHTPLFHDFFFPGHAWHRLRHLQFRHGLG